MFERSILERGPNTEGTLLVERSLLERGAFELKGAY